MTNSEFMSAITELYAQARNATEKYRDQQIKRGRKRSISSLAEDLLAFFILQNTAADKEIWVDYPITFRPDNAKRAKTVYPDISIVEKPDGAKPVISHIIDMKLDLGWKRSSTEFAAAIKNAIQRTHEMRILGNGSCRELDLDGNKNIQSVDVCFSANLKWHMPIISGKNIAKEKMMQHVEYAKSMQDNTPFRFYLFSNDVHPNGALAKPSDEQMNRFIEELKG